MDDAATGYAGLMMALILFGIVWAVLWLFVPFMIYAMHQNLKRIAAAVEGIKKVQDADVLDLKRK